MHGSRSLLPKHREPQQLSIIAIDIIAYTFALLRDNHFQNSFIHIYDGTRLYVHLQVSGKRKARENEPVPWPMTEHVVTIHALKQFSLSVFRSWSTF